MTWQYNYQNCDIVVIIEPKQFAQVKNPLAEYFKHKNENYLCKF